MQIYIQHYGPIKDKTYEETMLDVYHEIRHGEEEVPFRSWNYDSWFYYYCVHGVQNWTARPDVFPKGMESVYQETSLPVIAHNKYWCNSTNYAKQNGGQYDFILDNNTGGAVPQDLTFWEDLFKNASAWGLKGEIILVFE